MAVDKEAKTKWAIGSSEKAESKPKTESKPKK